MNGLIDSYVQRIVNNMSTKDLMKLAAEVLTSQYDSYHPDEIIDEVRETYPELLNCRVFGEQMCGTEQCVCDFTKEA
jgi:non-homologous end joining protein Ku